jgi:hypothetical protein
MYSVVATSSIIRDMVLFAVLWNRNYFLRRFQFRFGLLKSYGPASDFLQVTVPVRFRFRLHI